jgi:hypothetical protein
MTKIALFGAGGKMGRTLSAALKDREYDMRYVEISEAGIEVLKHLGLSVTIAEEAIPDADSVIFAVPDVLLGRITHDVVPQLPPGAMVILLDVAAALAGALHIREDAAYFFMHPCHHNILARKRSGQHVVCALMQGSEDDYALGEKLARDIYAPVIKTHRLTIEQMGLLEPALSETVANACVSLIRDATDEVIKQGVPKEAAEEFVLGHLTSLGYFFGGRGFLSDGAILTMETGREHLFKSDWRKLLTPESVVEQSKAIIAGESMD